MRFTPLLHQRAVIFPGRQPASMLFDCYFETSRACAARDLPPSPSWDEMHLQLLFVTALNNPERFFADPNISDELKDYMRNRIDAHIKKIEESESDDA